MKRTEKLSLITPLPEVNNPVYSELLKSAKKVKVNYGTKIQDANSRTQHLLANYSYLIYELLELNKTREIDYDKIKRFATEYKDPINSILGKYFPNNEIDYWLQENVDDLEMAMYERTHSYNKNIYH